MSTWIDRNPLASKDAPWIKWPDSFNAGTVDENEAWVAMKAAEEFFETSSAFSTYFHRIFVTGYRRCGDSFEFLMPEASDGPRALIVRVWLAGDDGAVVCQRVEVRRV